MVYAVRVEEGGMALDTMDFIALFQKKLCKVGAVLAGDAGAERFLHIALLHPPGGRCRQSRP